METIREVHKKDCPAEPDIRGEIVRLTSNMLDNPDVIGIFPTTKFYDSLEMFIKDLLEKEADKWQAACQHYYEEGKRAALGKSG